MPSDITADERRWARQAHKARLYLTKHMHGPEGLLRTLELSVIHPDEASSDEIRTANTIRSSIASAMTHAVSVAVPGPMCELVDAHAASYPDTRVDAEDMPMPYGWAHFEHPLTDPHAGRLALPLRALLWWTETDHDDAGIITLIGMVDTKSVPGISAHRLNELPRVVPVVSVVWDMASDDGGRGGRIDYRSAKYIRQLLTLWAIIRQRMADAEPVQVMQREYAHYARKSGQPMNPALRVVRLSPATRATHERLGGDRPAWAWQWWVQAHWRQQWYSKSQVHKPKLILPHLKGDETKPVKGNDRMYLPPKPPRP